MRVDKAFHQAGEAAPPADIYPRLGSLVAPGDRAILSPAPLQDGRLAQCSGLDPSGTVLSATQTWPGAKRSRTAPARGHLQTWTSRRAALPQGCWPGPSLQGTPTREGEVAAPRGRQTRDDTHDTHAHTVLQAGCGVPTPQGAGERGGRERAPEGRGATGPPRAPWAAVAACPGFAESALGPGRER